MNSVFRIKKNKEFIDIIGHKQLIKSENFIIYFKENSRDHLRFGLSVGKKVGNAVVRNKVKRQLRSFILKNKTLQKTPIDIIVVAKPEFIKTKYQENLTQFEKVIKNIL